MSAFRLTTGGNYTKSAAKNKGCQDSAIPSMPFQERAPATWLDGLLSLPIPNRTKKVPST
jgi:hypothetical protein